MIVDILTADKLLLAGLEASSVLFQGAFGEQEILDDHVNYMGTVEKGVVVVSSKNGRQAFGVDAGGFVDVRGNFTKILVKSALDIEAITLESIKEDIKSIELSLIGEIEDPVAIAELNSTLLFKQGLLAQKSSK